jgi:hypothetical protein
VKVFNSGIQDILRLELACQLNFSHCNSHNIVHQAALFHNKTVLDAVPDLYKFQSNGIYINVFDVGLYGYL